MREAQIINHAGLLLKKGHFAKAEASARQALIGQKNDPKTHYILGLALSAQGKYNDALKHLKIAVKFFPEDAALRNNLGYTYKKIERFGDAKQEYLQALRLDPVRVSSLNNYGNLLLDQQEYKDALACLSKAVRLKPNFTEAYCNLGHAYLLYGDIKQAIAAYRHTLEIDSNHLGAHIALAEFTTFQRADDKRIKLFKNALQSRYIDTEIKATAGFALGKALIDIRQYDEAFSFYHNANNLIYKLRPMVNYIRKDIDHYRNLYTPHYLNSTKDFGLDGAPQVFIVGFSRSGKSLVGNLLACHPKVESSEECKKFTYFALEKMPGYETKINLTYLKKMTFSESRAAAREYLSTLQPGCKMKVNTLPYNIRFLGLLGLLFPNAPIIFMTRDLYDLGISCYFKHYRVGNRFCYDLYELGQQIRQTERLIDFWMRVLPNPMLKVVYEKFATDPEGTGRNIYDFLDLDWRLEYFIETQANQGYVENLGLANSLDIAAPVRDDFVGCAKPFFDRLTALKSGYESV